MPTEPMSGLVAASVDPRDVMWEVTDPTFRVYFTRPGASREFELTGERDIMKVVTWATEHAIDDEDFAVLVKVSEAGDLGLIQVYRSSARTA